MHDKARLHLSKAGLLRASESTFVFRAPFFGYEERLPRNPVKMSQDRNPNNTVSFTGHKCEKLQKDLYDPQALNRIIRQLETIVEELYQKGYFHFMYSANDKFGVLAAEVVSKYAEQHRDIVVSTIPDNGMRQYYNLKYFIENSSVIVYCDGEKDEPEVKVMDK